MAAKTVRLYLEHIHEAIGLIEQYVRGRQRQDLDREPMLRQAIERNIEIVSEASRRLPEAMKARHPDIPWPAIAAIGNVLRHEYYTVELDVIWRIATKDLRALATAVDTRLAEVLRDWPK
ncbi:MAG: HepT-like ribonuclease domain-containing protein [Geminicoccaceae bacterium]